MWARRKDRARAPGMARQRGRATSGGKEGEGTASESERETAETAQAERAVGCLRRGEGGASAGAARRAVRRGEPGRRGIGRSPDPSSAPPSPRSPPPPPLPPRGGGRQAAVKMGTYGPSPRRVRAPPPGLRRVPRARPAPRRRPRVQPPRRKHRRPVPASYILLRARRLASFSVPAAGADVRASALEAESRLSSGEAPEDTSNSSQAASIKDDDMVRISAGLGSPASGRATRGPDMGAASAEIEARSGRRRRDGRPSRSEPRRVARDHAKPLGSATRDDKRLRAERTLERAREIQRARARPARGQRAKHGKGGVEVSGG